MRNLPEMRDLSASRLLRSNRSPGLSVNRMESASTSLSIAVSGISYVMDEMNLGAPAVRLYVTSIFFAAVSAMVSTDTVASMKPLFTNAIWSCLDDVAVSSGLYMTGACPRRRTQRLYHLDVSEPLRLYVASCNFRNPRILWFGL